MEVIERGLRMVPRFVSRNGFRPFIWNCGAALSRRASRASWSGRLLDDASDQYRRPASHWPLLLGAVENRPGDDGQEEAGGCQHEEQGQRGGWFSGGEGGWGGGGGGEQSGPSFHHPSTASSHSLQPLHHPTPPSSVFFSGHCSFPLTSTRPLFARRGILLF